MTRSSINLTDAMANPSVSVLIMNWNGKHYLTQCIDSILAQTYPNIEIILMDNGSTDGSADFVRQRYPAVTVVRNQRNLGTAEGNNEAVRHASGDYLFLINNDAWLSGADVIGILIESAARNPSAAIIGCQVLNVDGSLQDIGEKLDKLGFPAGIAPPSDPLPLVIDDLFFACNCAVLMPARRFRELGGYDGRYFWSHEEADLAWRARLRGYTVLTETGAVVFHVGGGSMIGGAPGKEMRYRTTTTRVYYRERSTLATLLKNYSAASLVRILPLYIGLNLLEVIGLLLLRKPTVSWQYVRAYAWNIRQLPATLRLRRHIQNTRCVSDREIARYFWPGIRKLQYVKELGLPRIDHVESGARWNAKARNI